MDPRLMLLSSAILLAVLVVTSDAMPVKSARQYLPPQPGYIPVYIQDGDNPPDVESLYEETGDGRSQSKIDSDVAEVPQAEEDVEEERSLKESEDLLVQQLTEGDAQGVRGVVEEARV